MIIIWVNAKYGVLNIIVNNLLYYYAENEDKDYPTLLYFINGAVIRVSQDTDDISRRIMTQRGIL